MRDNHKGELSEVINPKSIWVFYRGVESPVHPVHSINKTGTGSSNAENERGKQAKTPLFFLRFFEPDNRRMPCSMVNESSSAQNPKGPSPQAPFRLRKNYGKWLFCPAFDSVSRLKTQPEEIAMQEDYRFPESLSGNLETQMWKTSVLSSTCRIIFP